MGTNDGKVMVCALRMIIAAFHTSTKFSWKVASKAATAMQTRSVLAIEKCVAWAPTVVCHLPNSPARCHTLNGFASSWSFRF